MKCSAPENGFSFWSLSIPGNSKKKLNMEIENAVYHISNATFGKEVTKGRSTIYFNSNGKEAPICNLIASVIENACLDFIVCKSMNPIFVVKGCNEVTVSGYIQLLPDETADIPDVRISDNKAKLSTSEKMVETFEDETSELIVNDASIPIGEKICSKKRKLDEVDTVGEGRFQPVQSEEKQNKKQKTEGKEEVILGDLKPQEQPKQMEVENLETEEPPVVEDSKCEESLDLAGTKALKIDKPVEKSEAMEIEVANVKGEESSIPEKTKSEKAEVKSEAMESEVANVKGEESSIPEMTKSEKAEGGTSCKMAVMEREIENQLETKSEEVTVEDKKITVEENKSKKAQDNIDITKADTTKKMDESGPVEVREATVDTKPTVSEEKKCEQAHDIKAKTESEIEKKVEQHSERIEVEEATGEDEEPTIVEEKKCQKTPNQIADTKSVESEMKIEEKTGAGKVEEMTAEAISSVVVKEKKIEKVHDEIEAKVAGEIEKKKEEQCIAMPIDDAHDVEKMSPEEKETGEALESTVIGETERTEKQIPEIKEIKETPTEAEITTVKHIVNESPQKDTLTSIPVVADENARPEVKADETTIDEKINAEEDLTQKLEGNVGTKTKKTEEQRHSKQTAGEAKIETKDVKAAVLEEKSQRVQVDKQKASEKVEPKPKVKSKKKKSSAKKKSKKAKKDGQSWERRKI